MSGGESFKSSCFSSTVFFSYCFVKWLKKKQLQLHILHLQLTPDPLVISPSCDLSSCLWSNLTECPAHAPPLATPRSSWISPAGSPAESAPSPRCCHRKSLWIFHPSNLNRRWSRRTWPKVDPGWPLCPPRVLVPYSRRHLPLACSLDFLSAPANAQVGVGHFLIVLI